MPRTRTPSATPRCTDATVLYQEFRARATAGAYVSFRDCLARFRKTASCSAAFNSAEAPRRDQLS